MKNLLIILVLFVSIQSFSQEITGRELLEKAIKFHDPNGNWETFKGTLNITMESPSSEKRISKVLINLPNQHFEIKATSGQKITEYILLKDSITIRLNGIEKLTEELKKKNRLSKARAKMYRDYYTYLYGLPMKLNDPGTIIHEQVNLDKFMGDEMLVLKVTYSKEVGKDTWYFYFHQESYKMEAYQFFHDESKNDGEYILLDGLETINGIKMPKKRAWYMNKDAKYLGTDILNK